MNPKLARVKTARKARDRAHRVYERTDAAWRAAILSAYRSGIAPGTIARSAGAERGSIPLIALSASEYTTTGEGPFDYGDLGAFNSPRLAAISAIIDAVTAAHDAATDPNVRHYLMRAQEPLRQARFCEFTTSLSPEAARELFLRGEDEDEPGGET